MISALISRAGLTQEQASRLCGVSLRTIQNWASGKTTPSSQAVSIMETAAAEVEIESAEPMALAERIAVLRHIQQEHHRRCCQLEDDLAATRRNLADTTRQLNALYAERGKLEHWKEKKNET